MQRTLLFVVLVAATVPASALAVGKEFELTIVGAGTQDRVSAPVCVPLSVSKDLALEVAARVGTPDANWLAAQLTAPGLLTEAIEPAPGEVRRDLHFILPRLKAGETVTMKVQFAPPTRALPQSFHWKDADGEYSELRFHERPVLRYVCLPFDDSTKEKRELTSKVFHHLYDSAGKEFLTKGTGGEYPHHRGLFYGFKAAYGETPTIADTWHCPPPSTDPKKPMLEAHQAHEKILSSEAGPVLGRHRVQIAWHGAGNERFAVEERELTVYNVPGGQLVQFASRLKSVAGTVKLDGDPQHAGFHFRASNEVAVAAKAKKSGTYFLRPDGKGDEETERNWPQEKRHVDLPWNAMSFVVGGKRYTVAYFDRPENPKEARFSERTYGRIGSYFVAEFDDKKPLLVAYRLWLQEGEMEGDGVASKAANFATPVKVAVK
jgi:hypothetical protein